MASKSGGVMKAMTKLDIQLATVDSAIPFARARSGKISAPSSQGVGPQLFLWSVRCPMADNIRAEKPTWHRKRKDKHRQHQKSHPRRGHEHYRKEENWSGTV